MLSDEIVVQLADEIENAIVNLLAGNPIYREGGLTSDNLISAMEQAKAFLLSTQIFTTQEPTQEF